ncbi:MAG TPA: heavy-metal-associated domain-containing protein [Gaiellales bacterium]|nr:heavy-metal-associated domain-containing protein [Gaiellales bacterium]
MTRDYRITGMTCDHCVRAVRDEVSAVDGVEAVEIELASGRLEVRGDGVADEDVRAAVEEAGYLVA